MGRRAVLCVAILLLCTAATKKEATKALLAAAAEGEGDAIIAALAAGADPNAKSENGTPALVSIVSQTLFGREDRVMDAFLKAKVNINAGDADGMTPLMAAAATDRLKFVERLIAAGAKIEAKDKDSWTAVHYAAASGKWSSLDKLIAAEANVDAVANDQYTAVMMAIGGGRGGIAEKLLKAGAKFPSVFPDGASPLIHAATGRDLQAVRIALEHDAKVNEPAVDDGYTALAIAAWNDDPQIVMDLLRAGADPSIKTKEGKTPLDLATTQQNIEIIALLGGKWDKPKPKGGKTILIPCPVLGGTVESNLAIDGKSLVITTTYPHPLSYYFGGGNMNRAKSSKLLTFDGPFDPAYYFDTDSNAKTGRKGDMFDKDPVGADYSVEYDGYGTSVLLTYTNSKGEERQKQVYANVLNVDVKKGEESVDLSELGDDEPRAENVNGVLQSRVPLATLGVRPGSSVRLTAKAGTCKKVEKVALK